MLEGHYHREGHWLEDFDEAWNDYIWGDFDRSDAEEEKARDKFFKFIMKARDIQLISVGRRPRNPDTLEG